MACWHSIGGRMVTGRQKRGVCRMQLGKNELLKAYRSIRTIREFEERLHVEFATGEVPGFVHLYGRRSGRRRGVYAPQR